MFKSSIEIILSLSINILTYLTYFVKLKVKNDDYYNLLCPLTIKNCYKKGIQLPICSK